MKLKLDANGNVVVQDGKPVYTLDDGTEVAFDAPGTKQTIARLSEEAKNHRIAKEEAQTKLAVFGELDPQKAKDALELVGKLDQKKLIDAGQADKVTEQVRLELGKKVKEAEEARDAAIRDLHGEKIGSAFAGSKFITEKTILPADMAQKVFGDRFKVVDGKIVGHNADGTPVLSKANPGNPADFNEAIEIMVLGHANASSILKGGAKGGSGPQANGGGGNGGGGKVVSRSAWDSMDHSARDAHMKAGGTITD